MGGWLEGLPGIGGKRALALREAGLDAPGAIVERLPVGYRDWDNPVPLCALRPGEPAPFRAAVQRVIARPPSGGVAVTRIWVEDQTGMLLIVYFNQPYRATQLRRGETYLFYGRVERGPEGLQAICPIVAAGAPKKGIEPLYKPVEGVPQGVYQGVVRAALDAADGHDALPVFLRERYGLMDRRDAVLALHFPGNMAELERAQRRMGFERLFLFQIATRLMRGLAPKRGVVIPCGEDAIAPLVERVPYDLTGAQKRVIREILTDMAAETPMARLVQGDVGSGKTVVALCALYAAARAGWQGALMAPTEVLVAQHEQAAKALLEPLGVRVGRLTGSHTAAERRRSLGRIAGGEWDVVVGTHALFVKDVAFKNLGLVITDEQHRFGVAQRAALSDKGDAPNVLVMSATPIPRSLALILFGDLNVSIIDEMPPGRTPVKTRIVPEEKRAGMYGFIEKAVKEGRQCYIVCPLVEDSEVVDAASAVQTHASAAAAMPSVRCALLHGGMRPKDKEAVLAAFERRETDVLVSTTVIEVGINVPNATIMVIENAERFGLAQLHQLRGRVGRGVHESWCFLMSQSSERLDVLTQTGDGFVIAQKDLELRGPGDIYGLRQSGVPNALDATLGADVRLIDETQRAVEEYLALDEPPGFEAVKAAAQRLLDGQGAAYHVN